MRRTLTTGPAGLGLIAFVAVLLVAPAAWAQATGGISGQVTDTTGGALPGVTVEVSSPALIGGTQVAFTDGEGRYLATNLPAGAYAVNYTLPGFSTVVRDGLDIGAGFTANIDVQLSVGAVEETITVTGAVGRVEPSGMSATARRCCSNWLVSQPSCDQWPVLCGRIANSLT